MKLSICTTISDPIARQDPFNEAMACYKDLADEVIVIDGGNYDPIEAEVTLSNGLVKTFQDNQTTFYHYDWPQEFEWQFIGQQFQRGYEACTGDWVLKMDCDTFFSEGSMEAIRDRLESNPDEVGAHFYKMQFLLVDRFNVKTRQVLAVNKGKYGDRIKFNGGGDGCQPTLDGQLLDEDNTLKMQLPCYNLDFCFKTKEVVKKDFGRFARAWGKYKGEYQWGGPDDDSAFEHFLAMQVGRYYGRSHEVLKLTQHPKYVQAKISTMTPELFGYSLFGATQPATYFQ